MEMPKNKPETPVNNQKNGIDEWNNRLDDNLEPKDHSDTEADERAKQFSEKFGSGDQSDNAGE